MEKNRIILDTSGYSAYLRGSPAIRLAIQQAAEIFFNPIIVGELLTGYIMGKSEKKNRAILQEFLSSLRVNIVDIDEETSERYAIIMNHLRTKGTPIPTMDSSLCYATWINGFNNRQSLSQSPTDYN